MNPPNRKTNIKRILSIVAGIASFFILSRFVPIIFAFLTSFVLAGIPFLNNVLRFFSIFAMIKPFIQKKSNSHMTKEEACSILDLSLDATEDEIKKSYIKKMKKNHPDVGGKEEFAKKLTVARDLLLTLKKRKK